MGVHENFISSNSRVWTKRNRCSTRNSTKSGVKTKKKRSSSQKIREVSQILVFITKNVQIFTNSEVKTRIFMNFGLKPQKQTVFIAKSMEKQFLLINSGVITSILGVSGLELHSSSTKPVDFFRAQSCLGGGGTILIWGGTSSDLEGHSPMECPPPPWRRAYNVDTIKDNSQRQCSLPFLIFAKKKLANVGPNGGPMATPSVVGHNVSSFFLGKNGKR